MQKEAAFFAAIVANAKFRSGVVNTETRLSTARAGYLGNDFGVDEVDEEIFNEIGEVKNAAEFAQKYLEIKAKKT